MSDLDKPLEEKPYLELSETEALRVLVMRSRDLDDQVDLMNGHLESIRNSMTFFVVVIAIWIVLQILGLVFAML